MTHTVERRIMWGDLDALGIVFYPRFYEWIDASGHSFFEAIGLNLQRMWRSRQIIFGLAETSSSYRKPGRYHQRIRIETSIESIAEKTVRLRHDIIRADDETLLVAGKETRICLDVSDPGSYRAVRIPSDVRELLVKAC